MFIIKVYDSYGRKCNSRFFLNYGFVVENNESNEFPLKVELNENDKFFSYKLNLLKNKDLNRTFRIQMNFISRASVDLFSFLRFKVYDEDINDLLNVIKV